MERYIQDKLAETHFYATGDNNQVKVYIPFYNTQRIKLGSNITFSHMSYLHVDDEYTTEQPYNLDIEDNVRIGPNNRIEAFHNIKIERGALLGPNVYISDATHEYEDPSRLIIGQGMRILGPIIIGEGSWIGANVVIVGKVTVGRGAVVGANTVLNSVNVPDYSVVAGNPPTLIKIYDCEKQRWAHVSALNSDEIERILSQREK